MARDAAVWDRTFAVSRDIQRGHVTFEYEGHCFISLGASLVRSHYWADLHLRAILSQDGWSEPPGGEGSEVCGLKSTPDVRTCFVRLVS